MQLKEKKAKRKIDKMNLAAIIVSVIALLGLVCLCIGIVVIILLLKDMPKFEISDFNSQESSIVYDKNDHQIYELGSVIRENAEYEDIPSVLIDALVAVEDSRFYEHNGFDVPRFTRAFFDNLKTMTFSQGGSTLTMQLVKNTYFVNDEEGQGATKSIKRKVQEIAIAMYLENNSSKKEIITNYLNKQNYGGTNQNIRGVKKAAEYYFGKDVKELTLPEAAMLAGVLNSPYTFNPFNQVEDYAQERRDEVLYLMNYHGYISDTEYKLALATRVEDFLNDSSSNAKGSGQGLPYQAYVDYVVEEVYKISGLDPYSTPMHIHTSMDPDVQDLMDNIQAGNVDDYFTYPDDEFEVASICLNNKTGEIVGILGGRNYADGGALLLNHATDQYKQPGSSIKPILVYSQAFEVLGWSTSHAVVDKKITYAGTDIPIANATNRYDGEVTLKYAVGNSLNTPAIQTIRELIDEKGNTYLVDYLTSMGYDIDLTDFDEQYGIGGKGLQVSCLQMAGAYAAIMNGGYYTTPHAITKIEFLNEKAPVEPTYDQTKTISEQSCFLMSELLKNDVEGGYANLMGLFKNDNYKVYAKTGTTNWGSEGSQFGIPNGSIKDGWVIGCTSEFSVATWMGYEKAQKNKISYMTYDVYNRNIKGKITKLILDETAKQYGYPDDIEKPSGITTIKHIQKVGLPYVAPIEDMDDEYITTGYINSNSKYVNLSSPVSASVANIDKDGGKFDLSGTTLSIKWPTYPDEEQLEEKEKDHEGILFDYSWIYGAIRYKADINIYDSNNNIKDTIQIVSKSDSKQVELRDSLDAGYKVKACIYYGYDDSNINSNQSCSDAMKVSDEQTITIPQTTADNIYDYLSKYCKTISFTTKESETKEDGSVEVKIDGKTYSPGQTVNIHTLTSQVEVVEYSKAKPKESITLTLSNPNIYEYEEFVVYANCENIDDELDWYVDGSRQSDEHGNSIKLSLSSGRHTIMATAGSAEDSITIDVLE